MSAINNQNDPSSIVPYPSNNTDPSISSGPIPLLTDNVGPTDTLSSDSSTMLPLAFSGAASLDPPGLPSLTAPTISLLSFAKLVSSQISKFRTQLYEQDLNDALLPKGLHQEGINQCDSLSQLYSQARALAKLQHDAISALNTAQTAENNAIAAYNGSISPSDQNEVNTLNQAVLDYRNGDITASQYNAIVDSYNSYVSSRNAALASAVNQLNAATANYNAAVATYNAALITINATRVALKLTPLPNASPGPTGQFLTPAQHAPNEFLVPSRNAISSIPLTPNPPIKDVVSQIYTPAFNSTFPGLSRLLWDLQSFANILEQYLSYLDYIKTNIRGKVKVLPNAFIDPKTQPFFSNPSGSVSSSVSGIGLGNLIVGFDSPVMKRVFSQTMFESAAQLAKDPLPQTLFNQLQLYSLKVLSLIGLTSGSPALRLLVDKIPSLDPGSSPTAVALGLSFANQVSALIASGETRSVVLGFLEQAAPGSTLGELEKLASALTSGVNITLLQFALNQVGQSLGVSGLSAGVISNVAGLPSLDAILQLGGALSLRDALENPFSVASATRDLADQLRLQGIQNANELAKEAMNAAQSNYTNEEQFRGDLEEELAKRGVTGSSSLAQRATDYLRNDAAAQYLLDTQIKQELLNRDELLKRLGVAGISAAVSNAIVSNILNSTIESQRQLRDRIVEELVKQRIDTSVALYQATKAVIGDEVIRFEAKKTSELAAEINEKIIKSLAADLGFSPAQGMANQMILALLHSPTSILNQLSDQVKAIRELNIAKLDDALVDSFRSFIQPNIDLNSLSEKLRDPGQKLIFSFMDGLMYNANLPSNYQRPLDIYI